MDDIKVAMPLSRDIGERKMKEDVGEIVRGATRQGKRLSCVMFMVSLDELLRFPRYKDNCFSLFKAIMHQLYEMALIGHGHNSMTVVMYLNKRDLVDNTMKMENFTPNHVFKGKWMGSMKGKSTDDVVQFVRDQLLAQNPWESEVEVYTHFTTFTDRDNVTRVFNNLQHVVINAALQMGGLL